MFLSCHVLLPFLYYFFFSWDWRLTRGLTVYRLALNFFLDKVTALRAPGLDLQIPDVLYIEIETFTSHIQYSTSV
jgi:hypothetical protein